MSRLKTDTNQDGRISASEIKAQVKKDAPGFIDNFKVSQGSNLLLSLVDEKTAPARRACRAHVHGLYEGTLFEDLAARNQK